MRAKRNRIRRLPLAEHQGEPFFGKPNNADSKAFFEGNNDVQAKLAIGRANDPLEKEADSAARQVMNQQVQKAEQKEDDKAVQKAEKKEEEPVQKAEQKEEEKPVQKAEKKEEEPVQKAEQKEEEIPVQKAEMPEEEKPQAKLDPQIQAAAEKDKKQAGDASSPSLETLLKQRKGSGAPLPNDLRIEMEQKFKADFSQVRIHTDAEAVAMCNAIHAQAFTHGYDIYFNLGKYAPGDSSGKELLAHELAHVVQQKGA